MSDQNPFSEQQPEGDVQQDQQQNTGDPGSSSSENPFADQLGSILNEKGEPKYKDVNSALDALKHSQEFIEQLKREKQELESQFTQTQSELEKRESVEDVVKRLTGQSQPPQGEPQPDPKPEDKGSLDEETIRSMIENYMSQSKQQETEASNFARVQSAVVEQYGDKAREHIHTRAKELNTTPTELERLARSNPDMALSLLGGGGSVSSKPSTSSQYPSRQMPEQELKRPERSLLRGASDAQQRDYWRQVRDYTYRKHGIET